MCKVSVVTSIYNGEKYIGETIESIIQQTFTDWEYIIIDNASTDASPKIIEDYAKQDARIRFYRNDNNIGVAENLNQCFDLTHGKYIARTDADDLSYPSRLEKQFQYMEAHPRIALLGCNMDIWNRGVIEHNTDNTAMLNNSSEMRFVLPFTNIIGASTFFIRNDVIKNYNIRYSPYIYAEDFSLLLDILKFGEICSLDEPLVLYRMHQGQVTQTVGVTVMAQERKRIQRAFLEFFPPELRGIFLKAFNGEIDSGADMLKLEQAIFQYAGDCGLGQDTDELARKRCVQYVYRYVYNWQIGNLGLLSAYIKSPLKSPFWFMKRSGLSLIKQCLLQAKKGW